MNLLGKNSDGRWTQEHTAALNTVAQQVLLHLELGVIDMKNPLTIHVDCDDLDASAVLTQGEGTNYKIIQFLGRSLLPTELKVPRVLRLLLVAAWAVKKLGRYTFFAPQINIILPDPECVTLYNTSVLSLRFQAALLELHALGPI